MQALLNSRRSIRGMLVLALLLSLLHPTAESKEVISKSKRFRPIDYISIPGVVVSGQVVGDVYFASSWHSGLYAYDVSKPTEPVLLGHLGPDQVLVQSNENEDMATNGKILLLTAFNRADPANRLYVIDVRDPKNMKVLATVPGAGGHTMTCLLDCKWAYGANSGVNSVGTIVDLRNPSKPKLLDKKWTEPIDGTSVHDVTEVRPGLVVTSSNPMYALDVSDPTKPKILMQSPPGSANTTHNNIWPRAGKDRFLITASEGVNNGRCEPYPDDGKTLQIWTTDKWRTGGFRPAGSYTLTNGTGDDGQPPLDVFGIQGCSAHWAQEHPSFHNGGLVAMAAYSHGVRLLDIDADGDPHEVGYFLKDVQAAIDIEWVTDRILYVVEDGSGGGVDIIEYTGPLP